MCGREIRSLTRMSVSGLLLYNAVANRCMDYLKHQVVEDPICCGGHERGA